MHALLGAFFSTNQIFRAPEVAACRGSEEIQNSSTNAIRLPSVVSIPAQAESVAELRSGYAQSISIEPSDHLNLAPSQKYVNCAATQSLTCLMIDSSGIERTIPADIMRQAVRLFERYFIYQPYPLLSWMSSQERLLPENLPTMVLYPILALSLRTMDPSSRAAIPGWLEIIKSLSRVTFDLLCKAYSAEQTDMAYFQSLCLQAQVDFACKPPWDSPWSSYLTTFTRRQPWPSPGTSGPRPATCTRARHAGRRGQ